MFLWVLSSCRSAQNPVHSANNSFYTSPYVAWNNEPSSDPAYFPIGVWLQSPHRAQAYQAIGINTYVGLSARSDIQTAISVKTGRHARHMPSKQHGTSSFR